MYSFKIIAHKDIIIICKLMQFKKEKHLLQRYKCLIKYKVILLLTNI